MKALLGLALVTALLLGTTQAHALDGCPNNYAPLPSHPEVCVPAHKNLGKLDRLVNACVAHNLNEVQTEYAAKALTKTCASVILGGGNYRKVFNN